MSYVSDNARAVAVCYRGSLRGATPVGRVVVGPLRVLWSQSSEHGASEPLYNTCALVVAVCAWNKNPEVLKKM
jgi:hypothetical protein